MSITKITDQPILRRYSSRAKMLIALAEKEARDFQQSNLEPAHILLAMLQLREGVAYNILSTFNFDIKAIKEIIRRHSQQMPFEAAEIDLSLLTLNILRNAVNEAKSLGHKYVDSEHILIALVQEKDPMVIDIFDAYKIKSIDIVRTAFKLMEIKDSVFLKESPTLAISNSVSSSVKHLDIDLTAALNQIEQLQKETVTNKQVVDQLQELATSLVRVKESSEELKATIVLPPQEDMNVQLVPSHSLERLEEYRSDESIATLLIGLFGGATIGIVVNWITNENISITKASLIVIGLFLILTIASIFWWTIIRRRANSIKNRMTNKGGTSKS